MAAAKKTSRSTKTGGRKPTTRKRARKPGGAQAQVRCGSVEAPQLEKGWICCACFKTHGVGVYNGAQRTECKQCGHERCKGAMKRTWTPPDARSPIAVSPEDVKQAAGGFLGALARLLMGTGGSMMKAGAEQMHGQDVRVQGPSRVSFFDSVNQPPPDSGKHEQQWQKACDEVIAAFLAAELHAEQAGKKTSGIKPEQITRSVRDRLPRAKEIYKEASHPSNAKPCTCMHLSLLLAGAEQTARATGQDPHKLFDSARSVLNWYLASRN